MGDVIAQRELKDFYEKKAKIEKEQEDLDAMKQSFVDRLGLAAGVEPGPFSIKVENITQNRLDQKMLIENLANKYGEAEATRIKDASTKPIPQTRVTVKMEKE